MKKARRSTSEFKAMRLVLFDIHGVIMENWVSDDVTVNQHCYKSDPGNFVGQKKESHGGGKMVFSFFRTRLLKALYIFKT